MSFSLEKNSKIFVAGHNGLVGSAIVRKLQSDGYENIVVRTRKELDLTDQLAVKLFFESNKIDCVFLAAAKVGGIKANYTYPADFIRDNVLIQTNVIHSAWLNNVDKVLILGSSCIYPKICEQPIRPKDLLTSPLEETNIAYAIAKISGIVMAQSYRTQYGFNVISAMPTSLYGPGDNFAFENSHVLPGLLRKFHDAKVQDKKSVVCWGDGTPLREFLHVDDMADACIFLMDNYNSSTIINVGYGTDISILELVKIVSSIVGYEGEIIWDKTHPNGTMKKLLDSSVINQMGWKPKIGLEDGIKSTYKWFLENKDKVRC